MALMICPISQLASTLNALAKPVTVQAMPEANPHWGRRVCGHADTQVGRAGALPGALTNSSGQWLIDQILPYPSSASAAPAP